ncbi:MAG TPA: RNA polymerase-binding protein DksA [Gammaproteobacteria bacterium]|nr:RNA polymerase-binding protein DksA [Gammaproteobacteria bacterium]
MPAKKKPAAKKKAAKKTPAKKPAAKKSSKKKAAPAKKKVAAKKTAKKAASKKKPAAKKKAAKKTVTKKSPTKKSTAKKAPARKAAKSKTAAKKKPAARKSALHGVSLFTPYKEKRGEEYMSDAMLEHFRKILLDWKRELMEEVDRTVHHMQDEAANFPDPNDRATQESEFTMELRTRDRERKLIKKIDEALAKIDTGEYGYCEQCGVEIGIRRLEARPTATLCIDCKSLDEIREKTRA